MMAFLTVLYIGLNLWNSRHKKIWKITLVYSFLYLWVVAAFSITKADYYTYERSYYYNEMSGISLGLQPLWKAMMYFGREKGLSYQTFQSVIIFISLLLLFWLVSRYISNYSWVLIFYLFYPFALDGIQIRNFLAFVVVLWGIEFYIVNENAKFRLIKFLLVILLASMIHVSMAVYAVFCVLCIPSLSRKESLKVLGIISAGFCAIFLEINSGSTLLAEIFSEFLGEQRSEWLVVKTHWGFLLYWAYQLLLFVLLYVGEKYAVNDGSESAQKIKRLKESLWPLTFLLPIYIFNFSMYRYLRNFTILFYVCAVYYLQHIRSQRRRWSYFMMIVGVVLFMIVS
jgi:hypothetical protein